MGAQEDLNMWLSIKERLNIKNVTFDLFIFYLAKRFFQRFVKRRPTDKKIMFIMGCQRSGTSLLTRVFVRDKNAVVFREASALSSNDPHKLRLNPLGELKRRFDRLNCDLIVAKPLVESQNAGELLSYFPNGHVLWAYRHYQDVAASSLKAFGVGVGVSDIRPFLSNDQTNWRSQNASQETRTIIATHFSEEMNPNDAAALFWYARNRLLFDQNLQDHPRVTLLRYEDFAQSPGESLEKIYRFLGQTYPGKGMLKEVHAKSVKKGKDVALSPEVDALCQELYGRLENAYRFTAQSSREKTAVL